MLVEELKRRLEYVPDHFEVSFSFPDSISYPFHRLFLGIDFEIKCSDGELIYGLNLLEDNEDFSQ